MDQHLEMKIIARLRKHKDIPKFIELGRRLEELKERHEQGLLVNLTFIKQLLEIAKEVVEAEKEVETTEDQDEGKAALTELFNELRNGNTSVMVERIVNDIDQVLEMPSMLIGSVDQITEKIQVLREKYALSYLCHF